MQECPYKYALGVPGEGFHSTRIFGFALGDILGTIGLALLTTWFFKFNFWYSLLAWFIIGEILHYLFGTNTAVLTSLGIKSC